MEFALVIGSENAMNIAIANDKQEIRRTTLTERLVEEAKRSGLMI